MQHRQVLAAGVAVALLGSLAACGGSSTSSNSASGSSGSSKTSATLIMSTLNNPFFVSVKEGAEDHAKKMGINLQVQNANNSDSTSLNLATTSLTKQPGVLILDPVSSESAATIVKQANTANIPVMAFDRRPTQGTLDTFVGYDAVQAGQRAADALAKAINSTGTVVEIQGILGTNVAQDRSKGFNQGIKKYAGIKVVAVQSADFDRAKALDVMTNVLQAHPDINGVYAANDEMALGVLAALKAKNLVGKVQLVGNDGIKDALDAVFAGQMVATQAESPYGLGVEVTKLANSLLQGKAVAKDRVLEGTLVTKSNVLAYCQTLIALGDTASCTGPLAG
jgi:ribose transport system substrate-binding protein